MKTKNDFISHTMNDISHLEDVIAITATIRIIKTIQLHTSYSNLLMKVVIDNYSTTIIID